ncbi:MAG: 6-bladed beta-propeller [Gemmatimonadaceae bacterium]
MAASLATSAMLPAQPAKFAVSVNPTVIIGDNEADVASTLALVVGATRLSDGRIVVGDKADLSIKVFSPQGKFLKAFGRKGSGPGEINYLAHFWRCGNNVLTYDIGNGDRVTVFSDDLTLVRSFRFPSSQNKSAYFSTCNASGQFIHFGWENNSDMKAGMFRSNVPFWITNADNKVGPLLGDFAGSERYGIMEKGGGGTRPMPFGKQTVAALGASRAYVGTADSFSIMVFDLNGKKIGAIQEKRTPTPVTQADIDDSKERELIEQGKAWRSAILRDYAAMKFPKFMPAYSAFVVDALDNLWVQDYRSRSSSTMNWTVFNAQGTNIGHLALSSNFDVLEVGRDYVLGRYLDPDVAVPQVRMYQLTR